MKKAFTTLSFILCVYASHAKWNQVGTDINGEAAFDEAGSSVSLSADGKIIAIGAPGNDGNGSSAGHVRVYRNNNGGWVQIGFDIDGEATDDFSGRAVSLSADGKIVAIGANGNDATGRNAGHVRVFENINDSWIQIGSDIDGERQIDQSGWALSLSSDGAIIAIGAYNNWETGSSIGHVRVYKNINGSWNQIGSDIDGKGAPGDESGRSVSLSSDGNTLAIGATGYLGGHVRIYKNDNDKWMQVGSDIAGKVSSDRFGSSVSLSADGNTVAVGAPYNDLNGDKSGLVQVYKNNNGDWKQLGVDITGEGKGDRLGCSVSLSSDGSVLAIGAWGHTANKMFVGHVQVYKNKSANWIAVESNIDGEAGSDYSGSSVSLSADGSVVAIGAWGNDKNGTNSGHVRVYSNQEEILSAIYNNIEDIKIYPNPTLSIINVNAQDIKSLIVTDINGVLVKQESKITANTAVVDLSGEASGVYLLSVKTETQTTVQKIILE